MTVVAQGCPRCEPRVAPQGPRQGRHHVAIRFTEMCPQLVTTFLRGEQIMDVCEVMTGSDGWAIRYPMVDRTPQMCPCGSGLPLRIIDADPDYTIDLSKCPEVVFS